jgi:hypothetical protein
MAVQLLLAHADFRFRNSLIHVLQRSHAVTVEVVRPFFKVPLGIPQRFQRRSYLGVRLIGRAAGVRMATNIRTGKTERKTFFMGSLQSCTQRPW